MFDQLKFRYNSFDLELDIFDYKSKQLKNI